MKRLSLLALFLTACVAIGFAQRTTDILDRGLVAVPSGSGTFVSWRIFGEEYYDTEYNLYRNGTKVNQEPLKVSNYYDSAGRSGAKYQVAAVVRGVEQAKCAEVARLGNQYIQFAVGKLYSRRGTDITNSYDINDIALADLDGDGVSEFILKRNYTPDGSSVANDSAYNVLDCYKLNGERLWYIDLGPNMVSGPDEQYDAVGYDWDGDGKAEVLMRGADNMIIHHADGTVTNIGKMNVNTRNTVLQTANMTYTNTGAEYLLYMEGSTGKPYAIGSNGALWMTYPLPRGTADDWGDGYGHRSTKHYFGAPFLDGRNAYIFLGRGCYTKHHMKAFSVNPQTHQLTLYWEWSNNEGWGSPWYGNGYHNYGIADVDWDGRDEICFGSMVIDDNGKGLSTTGLGHGDAQHCSDFDPYRHGQEIFACNEDEPAMNYRDATTSKIYYRLQSTGDDGRALCGNFSNDYPGAIGHSSQSGTVSCVADKIIAGGPGGFTNNWRIYWDGDLLEEGLDGASSREGAARVFKADGSAIFTADGTANCNWTKNTPSAVGDVLGDWREEIIVRTTDNKYVRVYTTNIKTNYRNYTLWHDHQYRQGMVWESMGYNQPPHCSYFLGELEGITVAPPPFTMTGRTEIANGGTIGTQHNGKHVIVCDYADTQISITDGAQPWVATFNVPSWVQGTNSTITTGNPKINYTYYTCNVSGGGLAGSARLVKQGDGRLNLPTTAFKHTGNTDIWAGTVSFNGTMLNTSLWLNRFATLESEGGQFRSIKMDYAAQLKIGGDEQSKPCTVTIDTLNLGFGSRVVFDISSDLSADQIKTKLITIETKNWEYGPQYLTPVFEFVNHGSSDPTEGRYLIGTVQSTEGDLGKIRLEGLGTKMKCSIDIDEGKLYLIVEAMRESTNILWSGTNGNTWDLGGSLNFTDSDSAETAFVTGDNAIFTDAASQFTVDINGEIEADSVIVDNTKAYTFKGNGSLIGNTKLVKRGKGTLTVSNDNTYTGGNRISGGTVKVSSLANANQAKGNLGGVTTTASKFVIENGGVLQTTAAVTNGSAIRFDGEEGGVINNTADFISARAMSGTVMTKKGNGWMKLNVSNGSLTRMIVSAGTVQCINANVPAKTVEFQGGTLRENTSTSYAIYVAKGKTGTWYMANRSTYKNKVTGQGTLNALCVTEKGTNYYATRTPVECDFSDFEGTLKPSSSLDDPAVLRFTLNTSTGMPKGTMNLADNVEVQNSGRTFHVGKVTGSGALGGSCTFSNGASVGANTWQVGNDDSWVTTARVTSNANLVKVGEGKVTWSGKNTNTGTTTVSEGELAVNSTSLLGTGRLIVNEGTTLSGTSSASNPLNNQSVTIDGTLRPGLLETSTTGSIVFNNKTVTISNKGTLQINAAGCATATANGCTSLDGISTFTMNGTLRILISKSSKLQVGDSIRIFKANKFTGTPTFDFQGGVDWDTSRLSEGLLFVKSVGIEGDVNNDNAVDVADIAAIISFMAGTSTISLAVADVNKDGQVDVADIATVLSIMAANSRKLAETIH
ncbi:MAG: autotransporter-associated beta strand repeat-containing protein [Prevotella sp.]|nr:autotransporter-associated beta strand repeat-containing protein [Prevotella sp.]